MREASPQLEMFPEQDDQLQLFGSPAPCETIAREPGPAVASDAGRPPTNCERLCAMLRPMGVSFVVVDEAKRALFCGANIVGRTPHVVAYAPGELPNWLIFVCRVTPETRQAAEEWQDIFGEGFRAVFAVRDDRADTWRFRDLDGASYLLSDLER